MNGPVNEINRLAAALTCLANGDKPAPDAPGNAHIAYNQHQRLLDLLQRNEELAQRRIREAFEAGFRYGWFTSVPGGDWLVASRISYPQWRDELFGEGVRASMAAGREP